MTDKEDELTRRIKKELSMQERVNKIERYRILNEDIKKGGTLFVGSSLMEQFPIYELLMTAGMDCVVYNRGVGGFTTEDMLEHMDVMVYELEPSRIFINIGTNDMGRPEYTLDKLIGNYRLIIRKIRENLPGVQIWIMAYYPVNETEKMPDPRMRSYMFLHRTNENIRKANCALEKLAEETGCTYIDVSSGLKDSDGRLKKEYTLEGIHMYANGYRAVFHNLMPYLETGKRQDQGRG